METKGERLFPNHSVAFLYFQIIHNIIPKVLAFSLLRWVSLVRKNSAKEPVSITLTSRLLLTKNVLTLLHEIKHGRLFSALDYIPGT